MEVTLDCGDSSCEFTESRTGMRTNGGCRCLKDLPAGRRLAVRRYITALRQRVQELEQALKQYLGEYDAPAPDLTLRVQYRKALAAALAAAKGKP